MSDCNSHSDSHCSTDFSPAPSGFFNAYEGAKMEFDPTVVANAKIAAGAAGGGIVRIFLRPARSLTQTLMLLASCITCGFYATKPVIDFWTLPADYAGAVGALTGFLGLSVAEAALKLNFRDLLTRFLGKA